MNHHDMSTNPPAAAGATAIDPVCGMTVQVESAAGHEQYAGKDYYFCSPSCHERFRQDPAKYAQK